MLLIGIIGIVVCLASVVVLGLDLSRFIDSSTLHFTQILELMRGWTPNAWANAVNYINTMPDGETKARALNFVVSLPVTLIGLIFGLALIIIGFRVKRYR